MQKENAKGVAPWQVNLWADKIAVLGCAGSGKTWYTNKLSEFNPGYPVFHSDDYIEYGYKESLYRLLDDLDGVEKFIVEGVQVPRLLRKSLERKAFYPDIVFEVKRPLEEIREVYETERDKDKFEGALIQEKASQTVIAKYHAMSNPFPPVWCLVSNSSCKENYIA